MHHIPFWEDGSYKLILQTFHLQSMKEIGEIKRCWLEIKGRFFRVFNTLLICSPHGGRVGEGLPPHFKSIKWASKGWIGDLDMVLYCLGDKWIDIWHILEAPKSKRLWLKLPVLLMGQEMTCEFFHGLNIGHLWEGMLPLNCFKSCLSAWCKESKESSSEKAGDVRWKSGAVGRIASHHLEEINPPGSSGEEVSSDSRRSSKNTNAPHEQESALYIN